MTIVNLFKTLALLLLWILISYALLAVLVWIIPFDPWPFVVSIAISSVVTLATAKYIIFAKKSLSATPAQKSAKSILYVVAAIVLIALVYIVFVNVTGTGF